MRTKVELLKLLKEDFIEGDQKQQFGLCMGIADLVRRKIILARHGAELACLIKDNRPPGTLATGYFWPPVDDDHSTKQVRIDFLDQLIEKYAR